METLKTQRIPQDPHKIPKNPSGISNRSWNSKNPARIPQEPLKILKDPARNPTRIFGGSPRIPWESLVGNPKIKKDPVKIPQEPLKILNDPPRIPKELEKILQEFQGNLEISGDKIPEITNISGRRNSNFGDFKYRFSGISQFRYQGAFFPDFLLFFICNFWGILLPICSIFQRHFCRFFYYRFLGIFIPNFEVFYNQLYAIFIATFVATNFQDLLSPIFGDFFRCQIKGVSESVSGDFKYRFPEIFIANFWDLLLPQFIQENSFCIFGGFLISNKRDFRTSFWEF